MGQIFYWVLNMAIVSSFVGVIILVIRMIRKLPRNFIYGLYLILLIRLICPFGFVNGFSFLNLLPQGAIRQVNPITGETISQNSSLMLSNAIQSAKSYQPLQQKSNGWTLAYDIGAIIWLIIGIALLLSYFYMYIQAKKEFKKAIWIEDEVYQSKAVSSPITVGIFKSVIILPLELDKGGANYPYVVAHERTHIKKKDNLLRIVAILLTCIYWFNPMMWIFQKSFFTDMELACDESTIRAYDSNGRKNYAQALLMMSVKKPLVYATGFTGGSVKVRIKRVISYKQITLLSGICLLGFFILCAICLLSN